VKNRFETGRLEAFSDGVFAIAITLLVLEISVPADDFDHLWSGIVDQWPSYLAYVTSFMTVGGLWILHHGIFRRMRYADLWVVCVNLLLLLVVSFLPFPTKLVAEAIHSASAERIAVIFYGGTLLLISLVISALGRYVAGRSSLLADGVSKDDILAVTSRGEPSLVFYAVLLASAVFVPQIAAFGLCALAILQIILPLRPQRLRSA
jgi:uncharacterized membrane protein